jgi:plasmid stabilization system protein ParE
VTAALVIVTPPADEDITQAFEWYLANAPGYAGDLLDELDAMFTRIGAYPLLFAKRYGEVRRAALRRFPYLVWFLYFPEPHAVKVLAVSHKRQDPETTHRRLP